MSMRSKFLELSSTPLRLKIRSIMKEYPLLIDICCNIVSEKKVLNKTEQIIDGMIKLLCLDDVNISKSNDIKKTTFKSEENPLEFLTQFKNSENTYTEQIVKKENKNNLLKSTIEKKAFAPSGLFNQMENINDNIKQLFLAYS